MVYYFGIGIILLFVIFESILVFMTYRERNLHD